MVVEGNSTGQSSSTIGENTLVNNAVAKAQSTGQSAEVNVNINTCPVSPSQVSDSVTQVQQVKAGAGAVESAALSTVTDTNTNTNLQQGTMIDSRSSTTPSSASFTSSPDKITLKFLFANFDGVTVTLHLPLTNTANQVMLALLAEWPQQVEAISDGRRIRLLCMGKELNTNSEMKMTLKEINIPRFAMHPTPVNVSIIPQSIDPMKTRSGVKKTVKNGRMQSMNSSNRCCIIS